MTDAERLIRALAWAGDGALTEREAIEQQCRAIVGECGLRSVPTTYAGAVAPPGLRLAWAILEVAEASDDQ
jgi:hypothetical protein